MTALGAALVMGFFFWCMPFVAVAPVEKVMFVVPDFFAVAPPEQAAIGLGQRCPHNHLRSIQAASSRTGVLPAIPLGLEVDSRNT